MPPKKEAAGLNPDVLVLIKLINTAIDFKADLKELSKELGIAQPGNVPRKITSVVAPFGYEFKAGKVVPKDDSERPKTAVKKPVTSGDGSEGDTRSETDLPKLPNTPKTPKSASKKTNGVKTPASKKRKSQAVEEGDDEEVIKAEDDGTEEA